MMEMKKISNWLLCPICGNKTREKIREDTVLKNYPLYCPKCKGFTINSHQRARRTAAEPMNGG